MAQSEPVKFTTHEGEWRRVRSRLVRNPMAMGGMVMVLALVLVAIGIMVVHAPRFVESRFGSGRLLKALPIVSAVLVTAMGIWLCYEGVHGK